MLTNVRCRAWVPRRRRYGVEVDGHQCRYRSSVSGQLCALHAGRRGMGRRRTVLEQLLLDLPFGHA